MVLSRSFFHRTDESNESLKRGRGRGKKAQTINIDMRDAAFRIKMNLLFLTDRGRINRFRRRRFTFSVISIHRRYCPPSRKKERKQRRLGETPHVSSPHMLSIIEGSKTLNGSVHWRLTNSHCQPRNSRMDRLWPEATGRRWYNANSGKYHECGIKKDPPPRFLCRYGRQSCLANRSWLQLKEIKRFHGFFLAERNTRSVWKKIILNL